jgi:hypothetical protein
VKANTRLLILLGFLPLLPIVPIRQAHAYDALYVREYPPNGPLKFEIKDEINNAIYSWPRTLITYPVDFSHAKVKPEQLLLSNVATDTTEPFQLSAIKQATDGTLLFAKVSFFCDLKPGADRIFTLTAGMPSISTSTLPATVKDGLIEVDGGALKVRLPASRSEIPKEGAPSAIQGISDGTGWCGGGKILSPVRPVQSLETTCIESGPLFTTYRLHYSFAGGASYEATVRIVTGYPFVDLTEKMAGFTREDQAVMEFEWKGLNPTKRMPMNGGWLCPVGGLGIDEPVTIPGIIEEPHWNPDANTVEDPKKEMIFRLAAFQGNGIRDAVPAISFWEGRAGGQELGFFVPDAKSWDDRQYMVWQPTTLLQVRFRHAGGFLIASYPLADGKRETAITLHSVEEGEKVVEDIKNSYKTSDGKGKSSFAANRSTDYKTLEMRLTLWLRSWYGGLSLDKVKDWILTAPKGNSPVSVPAIDGDPNYHEEITSAADLIDHAFHSSLMEYPLGLNVGIDAIQHRMIRPYVQSYLGYYSQFTSDQRRRLDALLLLSAYVNSGDDLASIRCCISGTPNISSDGFSVPSELAVLYPKHPLFAEWADQFEKRQQLMGCFYTRPEVRAYDSLGGRWCESLAEYNWAYFDSSIPANTSLELSDGKNRFANPWVALRGRWLTDELSAPVYNPNPYWRQEFSSGKSTIAPPPSPWKPGIALTSTNGFERQYPAHGAHGSGTGQPVPAVISILAETLKNYDPMTAEYLFWATARRTSSQYEGKGNYWYALGANRIAANNGTDPHLKSSKYTGHGIILRSGVGTPEELSIHLDQTDQGPNYRWGWNGENSSGVLYFFANGQPWSGHERENTGDHDTDDAGGTTNFGVVKDGEYRSIGDNVLDYPLYDLGVAQFGEITARKDEKPYSWPVYKSRSIMLVGTDYFILCDDAIGDMRFSWFTMKDLPFPKLVFLNPLAARADHWSEVTTAISKGVIRDAGRVEGPNIVLVSHKKTEVEMEKMISKPVPDLEKADIQQYAWKLPRGERPPRTGVYWVKTPTSHDVIFRNNDLINYSGNDGFFFGTAGVVRNKLDGSAELTLFEGTVIGAHGVKLTTPAGSELGVSAVFKDRKDAGAISGLFMAPKETELSIEAPQCAGGALYIDGARREANLKNGVLTATLPVGHHVWELTSGQPTPLAPPIVRTENFSGGARVVFTAVAGADHYRLETSADGGKTWQPATEGGMGPSSPLEIKGLTNGTKIHVRVIAGNAQKESAPGKEYPVYVTDKAPEAPEGLDLVLSKDRIDLTWGEILGAKEYRLYRRPLGKKNWTQVFAGPERTYADLGAKGALPPVELPGRADNALNTDRGTIFEYAVTAVNGNGEGEKSVVENSDSAGWRNWWPAGQERRFKRQTGFWLPPYVTPDAVPPLRYPQ